ncbi:MAG: acyl-CoA thioesterase [Sedimentisphaerales bacterium]|nr:acyl-CoA thioesterase [Sedimentisphaerales bacterium]
MAAHCNITTCRMTIRVRYYEVDRQNAVHHSVFARYFEMGRTELLRANGCDYKTLEDSGLVLVVARLECRFRSPAHYDDKLLLTTSTGKVGRVRLEHLYKLERTEDKQLIAEGSTILVHVDREGVLKPMPKIFAPETMPELH